MIFKLAKSSILLDSKRSVYGNKGMEYAHKSLIILIIRRRKYILDTSYSLLFVERFVFGHGGGEKLEKVELRYANMRQHRKRNILWWRDASNNGAFITSNRCPPRCV